MAAFSAYRSLTELGLELIRLCSWHNATDKTTTWEKPLSLQTPFERALAETDWKEYTTKGRKYWVKKVRSPLGSAGEDEKADGLASRFRRPRRPQFVLSTSFRELSLIRDCISQWTMPEELVKLKEKIDIENPPPPRSARSICRLSDQD